jgi:hypothetical protein
LSPSESVPRPPQLFSSPNTHFRAFLSTRTHFRTFSSPTTRFLSHKHYFHLRLRIPRLRHENPRCAPFPASTTMPAASAKKRARQRANKALQKVPETPASPIPPQSPVSDDITHPASIERLLGLAKDSPPNSPLGIVWRYAFEEGKEFGYSEGTKLVNGLDINEITRIGVERGIERGIEIGRDQEKRVWDAAGHSNICIAVARPPRGVAIQTEDPQPRSTTTSAVQVDPLPTIPILPHTTNSESTVQTIPSQTQDSSSQTSPSPSPIPDMSLMTVSSSMPLDWADEATSLQTQILPSSPPRDFSGLRSSKSNPFSSLQHRSKRFFHYSHQSRRCHSRLNFNSFYSPHRNSYKPSQPYFHTKMHSHLNWESDPRLSDLSRSLKALGWIRAP